jgi:putative hydrolase of the HAD superfamily
MPSSIRLVIFDLGRVLIRICDDWLHAAEVAGFAGKLPTADAATKAVMNELVTLHEIGAIDDDLFCRRVGRLFDADPEHIRQMVGAYLLGPFEGITELIDAVHARGLKTACLSNTNSHHWGMMCADAGDNALPLHRLDYRFASHLARMRKPDVEIYDHVVSETGFAPAEILFFDDNADNVAAAKAHGWDAVLVTDRKDPVSQMRQALQERQLLP